MFSAQNDIFLEKESHNYKLLKEPDFQFISCTTFIELFFPPFDRIGIANNLTTSHPKYIGMSPKELTDIWDKAAEEGTHVHAQIENIIREPETPAYGKAYLAKEWLVKKGLLDKNIYPETTIYSKNIKIAGTVDLLVHDPSTNSYDIYDWKTSKSINQSSFNNECGISRATKNIPHCNFNHYSLQLSLYRFILEKFYNVTINSHSILHITDLAVTPYECKYFKSTIEAMLLEDINILKVQYENSLTKNYSNI